MSEDPAARTLDYQSNAEECQRMADAATDPAAKQNWLSLAQSWLGMIRKSPPSPNKLQKIK